ncbi:MAG TPA: DUF1890 domain-containing protein [Candidatus Methanoperedenaceae archaeon]|nr:DUF1890 domain-containing protein [Candidatus Methanoperedenaceae archaeon]
MNALIALGCPELPVQTSLALYLAHKLQNEGIDVTIAGTNAAVSLIRVADPDRHYSKRLSDLDRTIEGLAEKRIDYDLSFVFIHSDSGISYLATLKSLSKGNVIAVIFGKDIETLVAMAEEQGARMFAARAVHNPMPLKIKLDEVERWAALTS